MAVDGAITLESLSGSATPADSASGSLQALTGSAESPPSIVASLQSLTGSAESPPVIIASLEPLNGAGGEFVWSPSASMQSLTGSATSIVLHEISGSFQSLTGVTNFIGVNGTLQSLTGSAQNTAVDVAFETMSASVTGYESARVAGVLAPMTGSSTATSEVLHSVSVSLEALTGEVVPGREVVAALERLSGQATALGGRTGSVAVQFAAPTMQATTVAGGVGSVSAQLLSLTGTATDRGDRISTGDGALAALSGSATNLAGTVGNVVALLPRLTASAQGLSANIATVVGIFERFVGSARSVQGVGVDSNVYALNTRTGGLTQFAFPSPLLGLVSHKGHDFVATADGLYVIDGDTDEGVQIDWAFRTGLHDFSTPLQKRLPEVFFALRHKGPFVLRVWTNDTQYYDYPVPHYGVNALRQIRRGVGKGLKSRYYRIEVYDEAGEFFELDSIDIPVAKQQRMVG